MDQVALLNAQCMIDRLFSSLARNILSVDDFNSSDDLLLG